MTAAKRQHTVPRFYLRGFVGDDGRIGALDKATLRERRSSVEREGCERYFYDLKGVDELGGDPKAIDAWLTRLESHHAPALREAIGCIKGGIPLTADTRQELSIFAAVQFARTKTFRNQCRDLIEGDIRAEAQLTAKMNDIDPKAFKVVFDKGHEDAEHLMLLAEPGFLETLASTLYRGHVWAVGQTLESSGLLYTSDHPVVRRSHIPDERGGGVGFASRGVEIAMPLDQRHLLIFCEATGFPSAALDPMAEIPRFTLSHDNVIYYNAMQVQQSARFLYSADGSWDFAMKVCEEHPEFRDPGRRRYKTYLGEEEVKPD